MKTVQVYKFGGASVKNAQGIKNISNILKASNNKNFIIIISAIGKTTNALEEIVNFYYYSDKSNSDKSKKISDYISCKINNIEKYHNNISYNLFPNNHNIFNINIAYFNDLKSFFHKKNKNLNYNFLYDQIVSFGELISTKIVSEYLNLINIKNIWIDVRDYIITDNFYREANVNWELTKKKIQNIDKSNIYITQGFIGSYKNKYTTTLGREGSDYSASVFSYCLNAEKQIIWKDVPGLLNADPRYFNDAKLLSKISYKETIELSYYGASIIHIKTLKPLQNKGIPLYVKSFINPNEKGTIVTNSVSIDPILPFYIVKKNQILIIVSLKKDSFITEKNFYEIFKFIYHYNIKINLIQNSATDFSICIDDKFKELKYLIDDLSCMYNIQILKEVSLYTIRNYNEDIIQKFLKDKNIILKQFTTNIAQWIVK